MAEEPRLGPVARRLAAAERVLVVDDEHGATDFLRAYFRSGGYEFAHLDPDTPGAVVRAVDELRPSCVLLDLDLRGFSGAEAYELLRTDSQCADVPVIIVGGGPEAVEVLHGVDGIDALVAKPFNVNELADLVAELIASAARPDEAPGRDADTEGSLSVVM